MSERIDMRWTCPKCKHASTYTCNTFKRDVEYDDQQRPWVSIYEYPFEMAGPMVDRAEKQFDHTRHIYACPKCGAISTQGYELITTSDAPKRGGKRSNAKQTASAPAN